MSHDPDRSPVTAGLAWRSQGTPAPPSIQEEPPGGVPGPITGSTPAVPLGGSVDGDQFTGWEADPKHPGWYRPVWKTSRGVGPVEPPGAPGPFRGAEGEVPDARRAGDDVRLCPDCDEPMLVVWRCDCGVRERDEYPPRLAGLEYDASGVAVGLSARASIAEGLQLQVEVEAEEFAAFLDGDAPTRSSWSTRPEDWRSPFPRASSSNDAVTPAAEGGEPVRGTGGDTSATVVRELSQPLVPPPSPTASVPGAASGMRELRERVEALTARMAELEATHKAQLEQNRRLFGQEPDVERELIVSYLRGAGAPLLAGLIERGAHRGGT